MDDPSDDAAEFRCLVPFPDGSASFVHGFEAGMVWQRMVAGETPIENLCAYHAENQTVFERMAAAQGYEIEYTDVVDPTLDEWMIVTSFGGPRGLPLSMEAADDPRQSRDRGGSADMRR